MPDITFFIGTGCQAMFMPLVSEAKAKQDTAMQCTANKINARYL